jgi:beta-phosphoglucomutase-like phosphatase (HAD superfamily)
VRNYPIAIATSSSRECFDKKMEYHKEVLSLFTPSESCGSKTEAIVTGDEVTNGKPAPEIFLKAAERINCDPAKCIVFEDSHLGVQGARAAGMFAVALPDARFLEMNGAKFDALGPKWTFERIADFGPNVLEAGGIIARVERRGL